MDAGGTASDCFDIGPGYGEGTYDLTMAGPNRFLRRFRGDATQAGTSAEVSTRYATAPGSGETTLFFVMTNASLVPVKFTITSNRYRGDGPWTYTVAAGGSTEDHFNAVAYQNGWYDFTITMDSDASWSRRFTGHIETGGASVSG